MLSKLVFGSPTVNPLVEAARKALVDSEASAVTSDGLLGGEQEMEQVQSAMNKNAKASKLEEHPFGSVE